MSLEALSAMYDPDTMDFDEFVRNHTSRTLVEEQNFAYEQSLAQDQAKYRVPDTEDPKPTLAELRQLRLAKLEPRPDYTKYTVAELKQKCRERGLKGFTHKCKEELIRLLL
jgi:hypothetical protein